MSFYFFLTNETLDKNILKNEWKYAFEMTFTNFIFIQVANVFYMSSHWCGLYLPQEHQKVFFWTWWFFSWAVFFHGIFWNTGFVHVRLQFFVKSGRYSSSEVLLSSWFYLSKLLFISSDFDFFMMKLVSSSKFEIF